MAKRFLKRKKRNPIVAFQLKRVVSVSKSLPAGDTVYGELVDGKLGGNVLRVLLEDGTALSVPKDAYDSLVEIAKAGEALDEKKL